MYITKNGNGRARVVAASGQYLCSIHKALVIPALQMNTILIHATMWMDLEHTVPSETMATRTYRKDLSRDRIDVQGLGGE